MKYRHHKFLHTLDPLQQLPTLPHILIKLTELGDREETTREDLAQIIRYDASLCAAILGTNISREHPSSPKIGNIDQVLNMLDLASLKTMVSRAAFYHVFEKENVCPAFSLKRFWSDSLLCAHLAESLARKTSYRSPGGAFLSGLFHDLGTLILAAQFPWEYDQILARSQGDIEMLLSEEERLGAPHSEVGAWLLNQWNLEPFISDAVLYHHEPAERIRHAFPLVKILYVANILTGAASDQAEAEKAAALLGLEPSSVDEAVLEAKQKVDQTARTLDIVLDLDEPADQKTSFNDYQKQQQLSQRLTSTARDMALVHGASQSLFRSFDADSIIASLLQGLRTLFNIRNIIFFSYDPDKDMLIPKKTTFPEYTDPLDGATISCKHDKTLLADTVGQGAAFYSLDYRMKEPLSIIDEQILHVTKGDVLFCVPIVFEKQVFGALAMGVEESHFPHLKEQMPLLTMFSNQAGLALHITSLKKTQPSLSQKPRLSASAITAREVVHEVRTPLAIVKNYLKILEQKLSGESGGTDEVRIITEEVDRVSGILGKLVNISGFEPRPSDNIDFNALLSEVVAIFKESSILGPHIEVTIEQDPHVPRIRTDKNGMKQVIMNLMQNAIDALPEGGTIQVTTRYLPHCQKEEAGLELDDTSYSDCVEMTISDNGPGIPAALKERLSEPYTTTRGEEHAGLGLYIVHNIVKSLKGSIRYESEEGSGTTVRVILPLVT
ncbi:MAG: HDOD domain-containing protein [Thermodesulfobacteriota bacterium]